MKYTITTRSNLKIFFYTFIGCILLLSLLSERPNQYAFIIGIYGIIFAFIEIMKKTKSISLSQQSIKISGFKKDAIELYWENIQEWSLKTECSHTTNLKFVTTATTLYESLEIATTSDQFSFCASKFPQPMINQLIKISQDNNISFSVGTSE
ncbi:MAG: hypothetical protein OCD01_19600 [Fibrobacterales bacterium]